jgi:hypothetical protein
VGVSGCHEEHDATLDKRAVFIGERRVNDRLLQSVS